MTVLDPASPAAGFAKLGKKGFDVSLLKRLRQKLSAIEGGADLILTVRSEGYVLACPVIHE